VVHAALGIVHVLWWRLVLLTEHLQARAPTMPRIGALVISPFPDPLGMSTPGFKTAAHTFQYSTDTSSGIRAQFKVVL
jgi:hypothetical protein